MSTHKGSCHCGAVQYEVDLELESVIECNCSHCQMKGFLLAFAPAENFTLQSGEDNLADYQFNRRIVHHLFCKTCGVQPFGRGEKADGQKTVAINVRCLKDVDWGPLKRIPVDGRSK